MCECINIYIYIYKYEKCVAPKGKKYCKYSARISVLL